MRQHLIYKCVILGGIPFRCGAIFTDEFQVGDYVISWCPPPNNKLSSVMLEILCVSTIAEKLKSEVGYSFVFPTLIDIVEI